MSKLPRLSAALHFETLVSISRDILPSLFGDVGWHAYSASLTLCVTSRSPIRGSARFLIIALIVH